MASRLTVTVTACQGALPAGRACLWTSRSQTLAVLLLASAFKKGFVVTHVAIRLTAGTLTWGERKGTGTGHCPGP
eukprot:2331341-Rhodomonas_salina.1